MPLARIPLVGGYTKQSPLLLNSGETYNMYQTVDTAEKYMRSMAGLSDTPILQFSGKNNIRGLHITDDRKLFVVASNSIYQVDEQFNASIIGNIGTSVGYVGIESNDHEVLFVDGSKGWRFDFVQSVFEEIAADGFPLPPVDIAQIDGFFLVARGDTSEWYKSRYRDGSSWNALDVALIESKSTKIQAIRTLNQSVYIFGQDAIEPWDIVPSNVFPFSRNNGALIENGSIARKCIVTGSGILVWLAFTKNGFQSIMATDGGRPKKISTTIIEQQLQLYSDLDQSEGYIYHFDGHLFFEFSVPSENVTWTYDFNIDQWYRRCANDFSRFVGASHIFYSNKHLIGLYNEAKIYEMSANYHQYIDKPIRRIRTSEIFKDEFGRSINIKKLVINILPGQGNVTFPENTPRLILFISKDGGYTFDNGKDIKLPPIGNTGVRVVLDTLGLAGGDDGFGWVFKFEFFGEMPFILGDMYADILVSNKL